MVGHSQEAHDADEASGVPFLVMEFIDGLDLARHVGRAGPFDEVSAAEVSAAEVSASSPAVSANPVALP